MQERPYTFYKWKMSARNKWVEWILIRIEATHRLKRKCQKWVTGKIYSGKQLTYMLRKWRELMCDKSNSGSSSPPKKETPKYMLPEESTTKTRPTHILKQDRPHLYHQKSAYKNKANLLSETRQATVCVTRRVHIKNQANSHTETRQATSVSPEECT